MASDYFKLAVDGITQKGIRSLLTMIGIFIGIAVVVSLISLGQGLQDSINEQFEKMGTNSIIVMAGSGLRGIGSAATPLTNYDLDIIRKIRGVDLAGGFISKISKVEFDNEIKYLWVSGLPQDESREIIEDIGGYGIRDGRDLRDGDKYKVVIGSMVANGDVFKKGVDVGDKIKINDQKFRVVGIYKPFGNPDDDSSVGIPLETARELFDEPDELFVIMARTKDGFNTADVAEDIKEKLRRDRGLKEGEEDFTVQTYEQLREGAGVVLDIVHLFLIGIASISLMVGGVGIMNTMYTSVLERTREIGVMKAIGARNSDIMMIFLIESGIMGMVGGAIGVVIGIALSKIVEYVAEQELGMVLLKANVSIELILGALTFSFLVGCISGILPARQASKLNPVDALRYE